MVLGFSLAIESWNTMIMKPSHASIPHPIATSSWLLLLVLFASIWFPPIAEAEIRLPHVFGGHMVLQRDKPLTIWGWAKPGETVTVQLDTVRQTVQANDLSEITEEVVRERAQRYSQ